MKLTPQEMEAWRLSDEHTEEAIRSLQVTGYVIFEQVLDASRVQQLHSTFMDIFNRYVAEIGDNRGKQRQGGVPLPVEGVFAEPDLIGNPMVISLLERLLGPDLVCSYFASDTPLPGSEYQPVHRDGQELFPGVPVTLPPYMFELNVPPVRPPAAGLGVSARARRWQGTVPWGPGAPAAVHVRAERPAGRLPGGQRAGRGLAADPSAQRLPAPEAAAGRTTGRPRRAEGDHFQRPPGLNPRVRAPPQRRAGLRVQPARAAGADAGRVVPGPGPAHVAPGHAEPVVRGPADAVPGLRALLVPLQRDHRLSQRLRRLAGA